MTAILTSGVVLNFAILMLLAVIANAMREAYSPVSLPTWVKWALLIGFFIPFSYLIAAVLLAVVFYSVELIVMIYDLFAS